MKALELISAYAVAPTQAAAGASFAAVTGDSLAVRSSKSPKLLAMWHQRQASGFTRVTSPLLHDAQVGIKVTGPAGHASLFTGAQNLSETDELVMVGSGSGTAGDYEYTCMLIGYGDIGGVSGKFLSPAQLRKSAKNIATIPCGTVPTAAGEYSGVQTLASTTNALKAGKEYALLGATVEGDGVGCAAIGIRSPSWGNLRIGLPGAVGFQEAHRYFEWLSEATGESLIPVFRANDRDNILLDILQDEDLDTLYADLVLAEL